MAAQPTPSPASLGKRFSASTGIHLPQQDHTAATRETKSRDIQFFPRPVYSGSLLCSPVSEGKCRGSALNKTWPPPSKAQQLQKTWKQTDVLHTFIWTSFPFSGYRGYVPRWYSRGVKLTAILHRFPRLRMSGFIPLLHLCAFVACTRTDIFREAITVLQ